MPIQGYASLTSVNPGDVVHFHLSADPPGSYTFTIARLGGIPTSIAPITLTLSTLAPLGPDPWERGFGWPPAHAFHVPAGLPSGLYRMAGGGSTPLSFVVKSSAPGAGTKILLQICVNTPNAYNSAGGRSLYDPGRASKVSFDRPEDVGRYEDPFIHWLDAQGIVADYCTSIDLHDGSAPLERYNLLLSVGHDEYWSKEMLDRVEAFVRNGGNVAFFTGNSVMRQVRLENGNRTMACFKNPGPDPEAHDDRVSISFSQPPVNRPQNRLLGAGFDHGGWNGSTPHGDYTVRFPGHWVFSGVGPASLPAGIVGYECDAADYVDDEGYPRVTGEDGSPRTTTILATSDVRHWNGKPGRATMTLHSENGTVFNAAVISWASSLGHASVSRITRNVVDRLRHRNDWSAWEHIGHANSVTAITAIDGRLFCATSDNRLWRRFPVGADIPWKPIGHANGVRAMAASGNRLFCVTSDNTLWQRDVIETDVPWVVCGSGTPGGTRALAAAGGMLYATDLSGELRCRPASASPAAWRPSSTPIPPNPAIGAMTSYRDILFASTTDNRLVRTNWDFIWEANAWTDVMHANFVIALACIDGMLFAATRDNRLWWLDIRGFRRP
jgi:hypothetical protein